MERFGVREEDGGLISSCSEGEGLALALLRC